MNINKKLLVSLFSLLLPLAAKGAVTAHAAQSLEELTPNYAVQIYNGEIRYEDGRVDSLLYKTKVLTVNGDADGDGLANNREVYILNKNNKKYLYVKSHPMLKDTDGDGLFDNQDSNPLVWDISPRDAAMFQELVYREDYYIKMVLNPNLTVREMGLYEDRPEYKVFHNELANYWKIKQVNGKDLVYHLPSGYDAVVFETSSNAPYLKKGATNVLAIRGTKGGNDVKSDAAIAVGGWPKQATDAIAVMNEMKNYNIDNLYITGHSLGGYLAQLSGAYAYDNNYLNYTTGKGVKKVYTFNAPKLNGAFSQSMARYSRLGDQLTNSRLAVHYVVANDTITPLTGSMFKYTKLPKADRGHSSRSFFEDKFSSYFDINERKGFDHGIGNSPRPADKKI